MKPVSRRGFLKQLNCAALGSSAVLNTLLNLNLANRLSAQSMPGTDSKALVCLYLGGGCDSFNVLVPWESSRYDNYALARGATGSEGGLALDRNSLLRLAAPADDFALHPSCVNLHQMATGTGNFAGKKRLGLVANIGTLIQPVTKAQYVAWDRGNDRAIPMPKALFSHSDQTEQWQTAIPQGKTQLTGWAGRASDILHSAYNSGATSMGISFSGNNIFQVGDTTQQFVVTSSGALAFSGTTGGATGNPLRLKNEALRGTLDQHYTNLLTESFSRITKHADDAQLLFQSQFNAATLEPSVDALFPGSSLGRTLKSVLKTILIRNALGLRRQTFFVEYGGWDHHGELLESQETMLATLDAAIGGFQRALETLGLTNDVLTFTASDFGRTLRSNGSGTDHAWGGHAMAFGGPVNGGQIVGSYPDLTLDGPDDIGRGGRILPTTSVDVFFAEMLRWFGVPAGQMEYVLPNIRNFWNPTSPTGPLGLIA